MLTHQRLQSATTRELVRLVQDGGPDAIAAEKLLLLSHDKLVQAAARRASPEGLVTDLALAHARAAFFDAVRSFELSHESSFSIYCSTAIRGALEAASTVSTCERQTASSVQLSIQHERLALAAAITAALFAFGALENARTAKQARYGLSA